MTPLTDPSDPRRAIDQVISDLETLAHRLREVLSVTAHDQPHHRMNAPVSRPSRIHRRDVDRLLLDFLRANPGRPIKRAEMLDHLETSGIPRTSSLDVHLTCLLRQHCSDATCPLERVPGRHGYYMWKVEPSDD